MTIPTEYVAIDIETGGLPQEDARGNKDFSKVCILRIGAVRCKPGALVPGLLQFETLDLLVKPADGARISPKALEVNGLTLEQLEAGVPVQDAIGRLVDLCGPDAALVGHNLIGFDWPILSGLIHKDIRSRLTFTGPATPWDGWRTEAWEAFDTMAIWKAFAVGICLGKAESLTAFQRTFLSVHREVKSSLDRVAMLFLGREYVREKGAPHDPIADAILSARIFEAMRVRGILEEVLGDV